LLSFFGLINGRLIGGGSMRFSDSSYGTSDDFTQYIIHDVERYIVGELFFFFPLFADLLPGRLLEAGCR